MRTKTNAAPKVDAMMISQLPSKPNSRIEKVVVTVPAASITAATPKLAPAVIPNTDGPAKGFLKSVCI